MADPTGPNCKCPTVMDIAVLSGFAIAAVDRVLNGRPSVRDTTRERVFAVHRKLSKDPDAAPPLRIRLICESGITSTARSRKRRMRSTEHTRGDDQGRLNKDQQVRPGRVFQTDQRDRQRDRRPYSSGPRASRREQRRARASPVRNPNCLSDCGSAEFVAELLRRQRPAYRGQRGGAADGQCEVSRPEERAAGRQRRVPMPAGA